MILIYRYYCNKLDKLQGLAFAADFACLGMLTVRWAPLAETGKRVQRSILSCPFGVVQLRKDQRSNPRSCIKDQRSISTIPGIFLGFLTSFTPLANTVSNAASGLVRHFGNYLIFKNNNPAR